MRIRWHGHACFEISKNGSPIIVIDPHDGTSIGIDPPDVIADIILITHDHYDHNVAKAVEKEGSIIIRAEAGEITIAELKIKGIETSHDKVGGTKRGKNILYKFAVENISFCHLGDVGHILTAEQLNAIGHVDIVFIPIGGVYTIDAEDALKLLELLKPKISIPMHYSIRGLSIALQPLDKFLSLIENTVYVGNEINFDPSELDDISNEVWVFSL